MCPLSLETLFSGLSWVDNKKDVGQVMEDKLHCFQREIFLHEPSVRVAAMERLVNFCNQAKVCVSVLPDSYIEQVYNKNSSDLVGYSWQGSSYS